MSISSYSDNEPPAKRAKTLPGESASEVESGSEHSDSDTLEVGPSNDNGLAFKINEDYARRFEHNKKREEIHRLEEKYGSVFGSQKRNLSTLDNRGDGSISHNSSSSTSEDEDDEGFLATEALDAEISATLQAIRSKDPRVYDEKATFYSEFDEGVDEAQQNGERKEKPMFLRDYHRRNLLDGPAEEEEPDNGMPKTYIQEQDNLKNSVVKEMHAAADDMSDESGDEDVRSKEEDGGFLIPKNGSREEFAKNGDQSVNGKPSKIDIAVADKDPENFLSNFLSARAWVPTFGSRFQPFESDDEEEDSRAEAFETAYNFRFEDPKGANEKLMSHARDASAKYSVRREDPSGRRKARDVQRERKDAVRQEREEDKARLRRLKIDQVEEKVRKIREAAGIRGKPIKEEDWAKFLEAGWNDDDWDKEMEKRFGDSYYADEEETSHVDEDGATGEKRKEKFKKPKWDDDIDIQDLVPDFKDDEKDDEPAFTLSDDEDREDDDDPAHDIGSDREADPSSRKSKTKKERLQERSELKRKAQKDRKRIEEIVDEKLDLNHALPSSSKNPPSRFRYRETSPLTYGLTARDILMASDSQLNQYAGLKKMAAFRDANKKKKDKKRLGKKARLRQWRKETFGSEEGPATELRDLIASQMGDEVATQSINGSNGLNIRDGAKRKKRSRKGKGQALDH
ncbi:MAG: KRRI-Interacting protein 1 [Pycnora praestabilis]|nr:MAG: KRRI-Interacting protein 1 [Pycnora praestabilis]